MENFDDAYEKFHRLSVKTAFRIVKDKTIAEDISQDVFYHLYEIRDTLDFSNERKLRALISAATANKARDYFKKSSWKREKCALEDVSFWEKADEALDPESILIRREEKEYVRLILDRLQKKNPLNYEILIKIKVFGMLPDQIAAEYGITRNNVNNRILRTRAWIREEWKRLTKNP